jgi:hypothetical protein
VSNSKSAKEWYRLDNAAIIFSLITSPSIPSVFRVSVTMQDRVHLVNITKALHSILPRFPYFRVSLKKGIFWYYLEENLELPEISAEAGDPCQYIPVYTGCLPFRLIIYYNRIMIEFNHALTDGAGSTIFMNSLVSEYLELQGKSIEEFDGRFLPDTPVDFEEYEDAFKRHYNPEVPKIPTYSSAFQLPFPPNTEGKYYITTAIINVDDLKQVTHTHNLTITEFLVSIYLYTLQEIYYQLPSKYQDSKPIRVSIPVNLRNLLPSRTLRNFSLHVMVGLDPRMGVYSLEEIFHKVHHSMQSELTEKFILTQIKRNVGGEMNPMMRITPRILKDIFGTFVYQRYGERQFTGSLTNPGLINLPDSLSQEIDRYEFYPSPNRIRKVSIAMSGYNGKIYLNVGRVCDENYVERIFFTKLTEMGIPVRIETNYS